MLLFVSNVCQLNALDLRIALMFRNNVFVPEVDMRPAKIDAIRIYQRLDVVFKQHRRLQ
jgi:hypothetical protein